MKKVLLVLSVGLLALGLIAVTGCGGGEGTTSGEETEVISLDENVEEGIVGTYRQNVGGTGSIVFQKDGTFEGDAWGSPRKGKYEVEDTEDHNRIVLTFDDAGPQETWGIGISMGKVVAVTSPDAVQYDKVTQ
ncbi:MAG: hypothetical protein KKF41_09265 [Actinobacteria bacterium]|nr:hypothetical protein [Actinomycetota bacterium]MBU1942997.1 hypothetical protein [Actinomycetota bacterium]MBU2687763.1 hypothetical protein [Actinomycetota bacterium]